MTPPASAADEDASVVPASAVADPAALLEGLLTGSPLGLALFDRSLVCVSANEALARLGGHAAADHAGRTPRELFGAQAARLLEPALHAALAGRATRDLALTLGGDPPRDVLAGVFASTGAGGAPLAALAAIERGDRLAGDRDARAAEQSLHLALEGTATGSWEWNARTDTIRWSQTVGPLHGLPRGAGPSTFAEYLELVHAEDRGRLERLVRDALGGSGGYETEFRVRWPDGTERWLHVRAHALLDGAGHARALVGLTSDVTDRMHRERASQYLARASLALATSLDVAATLEQVAELAVPDLADWCSVSLADPQRGVVTAAIAHSDPHKVRWAWELNRVNPPNLDAPTGVPAVLRTGRSELYPEVPEDLLRSAARNDEELRIARELQIRSAMVVPMVARGRTLGAISFVYAESGREYSTADLELAEELGRRAGLALDNARLLQAEQAANRRLRALQTVTDIGLSHLDQRQLLPELLERVRAMTHADIAVVLLQEPDRGDLVVVAALGISEESMQRTRVPIGRGVAGRIAASSRPVIIDDLREVEVMSQHLRTQARSLAGVPLRVDGMTIGVLHVATRERRTFGREEVELLELVADRAARAIAHSRLYESARATSLTLQRSLLPSRVADVPGGDVAVRYVPGQEGSEVGGDWYDVFALPDGRHAIVVGDVAGRGIEAAAVMGHVRASVRACVFGAPSATTAIEALDRLVEALEEDVLATLVLVLLAADRTGAEVCCAGHPAPLHLPPGRPVTFLEVRTGPPVGAPVGSRASTSVALEAGAMLLLFTDGLIESRTVPLVERLVALREAASAAPRTAEGLADACLERMRAQADQPDDIAVVALCLSGSPERSER
jgi:GAF domain-containing protein/PAS domain-containing protein